MDDIALTPDTGAELARLQSELSAAKTEFLEAQAKAQWCDSGSARAKKAKRAEAALFAIQRRILELLATNDR
jgi:hypothetical protein